MQQFCGDNFVPDYQKYCSASFQLIAGSFRLLLTTKNNIIASCFQQPVTTHTFGRVESFAIVLKGDYDFVCSQCKNSSERVLQYITGREY